MDNLEKYIKENRDKFDIYEPNASVWDKIREKQQPKKYFIIRKIKPLLKIAAVVTIFLSAVMIAKLNVNFEQKRNNMQAVNENTEVKYISKFVTKEKKYKKIYETKLKKADKYLVSHPMLKKNLDTDIAQLDSIYIELKKDLKDGVANEEVIKALIRNYKTKIDILENLMLRVKKYNEDTKEDETNNEKVFYEI